MNALADANQRRVEQLLLLAAASEFDGEALNALRAAARIAASAGQTAAEALRASVGTQLDLQRITALEQDAFARGYRKGVEEGGGQQRPCSWPAFAGHLLRQHSRLLSEWEHGFCRSFVSQGWPTPTPKQRAVFERIAARCGECTPS